MDISANPLDLIYFTNSSTYTKINFIEYEKEYYRNIMFIKKSGNR